MDAWARPSVYAMHWLRKQSLSRIRSVNAGTNRRSRPQVSAMDGSSKRIACDAENGRAGKRTMDGFSLKQKARPEPRFF
jgi:hypothetical protein